MTEEKIYHLTESELKEIVQAVIERQVAEQIQQRKAKKSQRANLTPEERSHKSKAYQEVKAQKLREKEHRKQVAFDYMQKLIGTSGEKRGLLSWNSIARILNSHNLKTITGRTFTGDSANALFKLMEQEQRANQ